MAGLQLTEHPRAQRAIRKAKGWGGLVGFLAGFVLSARAGVPVPDAVGRAVLLGTVGLVTAWGFTVLAWRQLAQAEIELRRRKVVAHLLELEREAKGGG